MFKTKEGLFCFTTPQEKILFKALTEISSLDKSSRTGVDYDGNEYIMECVDVDELDWICEETMKKLNDSLEKEVE